MALFTLNLDKSSHNHINTAAVASTSLFGEHFTLNFLDDRVGVIKSPIPASAPGNPQQVSDYPSETQYFVGWRDSCPDKQLAIGPCDPEA